jgi:plastocyanin
MLRRAVLLLLAAVPARAAAAEVIIADMDFGPAELAIAPGTTVTWRNRDDSPHNVVSSEEPRLFRSRLMETGEAFSVTFETPGRHAYYCALHPHMTGTVIVA